MVREVVQHIASVCRDERRMQVAVGRVIGIIGFAGFIALGAHLKVAVPGNPVPFTLQTFFVLLAGAYLGPLDGAIAVMMYLAIGAAGMPIFANSSAATGLAYFSGATGGYLVGFLAAAVGVGLVTRRTHNFYMLLAAFAEGVILIHLFGVIHLAAVLNVPLMKAAAIGSLPFIAADALKAGLALAAYMYAKSYMHGVRRKVL